MLLCLLGLNRMITLPRNHCNDPLLCDAHRIFKYSVGLIVIPFKRACTCFFRHSSQEFVPRVPRLLTTFSFTRVPTSTRYTLVEILLVLLYFLFIEFFISFFLISLPYSIIWIQSSICNFDRRLLLDSIVVIFVYYSSSKRSSYCSPHWWCL